MWEASESPLWSVTNSRMNGRRIAARIAPVCASQSLASLCRVIRPDLKN